MVHLPRALYPYGAPKPLAVFAYALNIEQYGLTLVAGLQVWIRPWSVSIRDSLVGRRGGKTYDLLHSS